jgi:hypothetical protein
VSSFSSRTTLINKTNSYTNENRVDWSNGITWQYNSISLHHMPIYLLPANIITYSNMTSFFRFVSKQTIYRVGMISLAHVPVYVADFPGVNVHVDELSSARIWQHKLCTTFFPNVNINYHLPIKVYYRICTLRHIRIDIIHENQNLLWGLPWIGRY